MQSKFIQCESREQALDACPWACEIIEVDGGFQCFESMDDVKVWELNTMNSAQGELIAAFVGLRDGSIDAKEAARITKEHGQTAAKVHSSAKARLAASKSAQK